MKLISVFFPGRQPGTFRRAIISEDDFEFFNALGAESRPDHVTKQTEKQADPEEAGEESGQFAQIDIEKLAKDEHGRRMKEAMEGPMDKGVFDMMLKNSNAKAPDPEKGWGRFGSVEWHQNQIKSMDSKRKIASYIKKICGTKMKTKNITLERVKINALTNIRRAANGSESQ